MVTFIAVSSKHFAILALNSKFNHSKGNITMTNVASTHGGVNVLLGGAMMSGLLVMILCICYVCHVRFQKLDAQYAGNQSWEQTDSSGTPVHIFTLDEQCYDLTNPENEILHQPPPSYESVIARDAETKGDDDDLPNYETAMKLLGRGYV